MTKYELIVLDSGLNMNDNTLNKYGKTLVDAANEYESYANKIG